MAKGLDTLRPPRADTRGVIEKIRDDLGLDHCSAGLVGLHDGRVVGDSTYDQEWVSRYFSHGLFHADPTLTVVTRSIAPTSWRDLRGQDGFDETFGAAADYGIPDRGFTIPTRGFFGEIGLLSISSREPQDVLDARLGGKMNALQQYAGFICDVMSFPDHSAAARLAPALSQIEIDILQYTREGMGPAEISERMGMGSAVQRACIASAKSKLKTLTLPQAAARAVTMKLIPEVT